MRRVTADRRARSWRGIWAAALIGCSSPSPPPSAARAPSAEIAEPNYTAPNASGWGKAGALQFFENVPAGTPRDRKLPLLLMIHGMGDRPSADWLAGFDAGVPVRVIMPQAPSPYFDGFSWFAYEIHGPNDPEQLARGISQAADQIVELLNILTRKRPTRGRPVVAGFSQGGMLSYALALRHPERIHFALPIAGMLPEPLWPTHKPERRVPIRALHGTADSIIDITATRALQGRLHELGFDATLEEFPGVDHAISPEMQDRINTLLRERL